MSRSTDETNSASEFRNVATDNSKVGVQAGVIHEQTIYQVSDEQTAAQKVEIGIKRLEGGDPRQAEKLISDVVLDGHIDSRTAYYWALSILSGRTRDQLDDVHLMNLDRAYGSLPSQTDDSTARALGVVKGLVDLLRVVDDQDMSEAATEPTVLAAYDRLEAERSAEIRRYLDQVLDGVLLEHLHKEATEEAALGRLANGRADRVWKFFEPDPAMPEWIPPPKPPRLGAGLKLSAAVAIGVAASFPIVPLMVRAETELVVGLVLLAAGLAGLMHCGLQRRLVLAEREIEARMFALPMEDGLPWRAEGRARFVKNMVAGAFNRYAPSDREERGLWNQATKRYRLNLTRQYVEVYQDSEVLRRPTVVRWLADWHAKQLAERWDSDRPDELYSRSRVPARVYLGMAVAAIATTVGAALAWWPLWIHGTSTDSMVFPLLIVSGVRVTFDQACWLVSSVQIRARETNASDQRFQSELSAYRAWRDKLADRPRDVEMANWLDFDKRYLRAMAMELYQVTNPDVIAHATVASPSIEAKSARVRQGPKRYTGYVIEVLLMTRGGVRLAEFDLDMQTGAQENSERLSFRYDTIASLHVSLAHADPGHEWGARAKKFGSNERNGTDESLDKRPMEQSGYRMVFRIVLVNQEEPIEAILDVFDDEIQDTQQQAHELVARALDSSGVAGARRMLEAISADGKGWLQAQENRNRRRRHRSEYDSSSETGVEVNGTIHTDKAEPVLT